MKHFERILFDTLVKEYNFYISELTGDTRKWVARLKVDNGEIPIIVVDKENKDDAITASLGNAIKIIYGEYYGEALNLGEMYFSPKENRIVASWNEETPFVEIINNIFQNREVKNQSNVTFGLIAINVVIFIISAILSKNFFDIDTSVLFKMGAKYNQAILNNGEYWRLIASTFLHGGIIHLAVNMYSVYYAGAQVHKVFGGKKYIAIYILSGLGASITSMIDRTTLSVGASGAIFGLIGAMAAFAYIERRRIGKQYLMSLISILLANLMIGFILPNIDNLAHLGGLVVGLVLGFILYKKE